MTVVKCQGSSIPEKKLNGEEGDTDGLHHSQPWIVNRLAVDIFHLNQSHHHRETIIIVIVNSSCHYHHPNLHPWEGIKAHTTEGDEHHRHTVEYCDGDGKNTLRIAYRTICTAQFSLQKPQNARIYMNEAIYSLSL